MRDTTRVVRQTVTTDMRDKCDRDAQCAQDKTRQDSRDTKFLHSYLRKLTGEYREVDLGLDVVHDRHPLLRCAALALCGRLFDCFVGGGRADREGGKSEHKPKDRHKIRRKLY